MTIINDIAARRDYPFEHLEMEPLTQTIRDHLPVLNPTKSILRYLECFLQITDQKLSFRYIVSPASDELFATFCGAIASQTFTTIKKSTILANIRTIKAIVNVVRSLHNSPKFLIFGLNRLDTASLDEYRIIFEKLHLNEDKVWYWSGWACINGAGKTVNLALAPVYHCFGRDFTQRFLDVCETFLASRRSNSISFVVLLSRYITTYPNAFLEADLYTSSGSTRFFSELWKYYYTDSVKRKLYHESVIARWRNDILPLIKHFLIPSGLFANPSRLPEPAPVESRGKNKNLRERSGEIVKGNLLVDVPLHISNDEAFRHLKHRIIFAHNATILWCDTIIEKVRAANAKLDILACEGRPILTGTRLHDDEPNAWLASDRNPDQLRNLAATLQTYGYDELRRVLKICSVLSPPIAKKLGLPTTDVLIPFCLKLISIDPRITPSFLKSVEIIDKNGKRRGVESGDTIEYLHGHKDRRGATKSEIRIPLNPESESIVKLLISITSPLRDSLRNAGDNRWRKLLLTSQQYVGVPCEFGCKAKTDDARTRKLAVEIAELTPELSEWDPEDLKNFAKSILCPSKMRATSGVVHFFKTGSLYSMAKTLGHANFDPKLLGTYLPTSILHYFRDRWVRVFQTGVIVQAMKSSNLLLEATGFKNEYQLAKYLENHLLPGLDKIGSVTPAQSRQQLNPKVLITISIPVARILLTLRKYNTLHKYKANHNISETVKHWSDFSSHLLNHLKSDQDNNLEALEIFRLADELGPLSDIEDILNE